MILWEILLLEDSIFVGVSDSTHMVSKFINYLYFLIKQYSDCVQQKLLSDYTY